MNNANSNNPEPSLHQANRPRRVTPDSSVTQTDSEVTNPDS